MTPNLVARVRELGLDDVGLNSVSAWIEAGLHHLTLPGCTDADRRWSFNHALRAASVRIACQGNEGRPVWLGRVMSKSAAALLAQLAASGNLKAARAQWPKLVTFEHQERVEALRIWAAPADEPPRAVDAIVERLLLHPTAIITRDEDSVLNSRRLRTRGEAPERYLSVGIETIILAQGAKQTLGKTAQVAN